MAQGWMSHISRMNQLWHTNGDVGGGGRDPKTTTRILYCKKNKKNPMSGGRRHLLQHYWYRVPVIHILKCHLMGVRSRCFYWYKPNWGQNSTCKEFVSTYDLYLYIWICHKIHAYEWVTNSTYDLYLYIWMSHDLYIWLHMNESQNSRIWLSHKLYTFIREP